LCDNVPSVNYRFSDAAKGGPSVGSRVRIAAATCLVASGLLVGGAGGALAFADPARDAIDLGEGDGTTAGPTQDESTGQQPGGETDETDPGVRNPVGQQPAEQPDSERPDGERPDGGPHAAEPGDGRPDEGEDEEPADGGATPTREPEPTETPPPPPPEEEPEPGNCEEKSDEDCGVGWPWWPWPEPGVPPEPGSGGGGTGGEVPAGRPELPPAMQLPAELLPPDEPSVIDAAPGLDVGAAAVPLAPITLPVIVAPPAAVAGGGGVARLSPADSLPGVPRGSAAEPPASRQTPKTDMGSNVTVPNASYRAGYADYLRTAGVSQVVALAAPGLAGILVLTGAGGFFGYRQAKAGHAVHTSGTARFVN
jgi:hypothetical protein